MGGGAWRSLDFAAVHTQVLRLAQALLGRGLDADRPLVLLSGNSLEHALLALAALHVGVPVVPVSPGYALLDTGGARLRHVMERLTPGLVFADDGDAFGAATRRTVAASTEVVLLRGGPIDRGHTPFDSLLQDPATEAGAPNVQDAVVTGHGRDELGLLVFLWPHASTLSPSLKPGATLADVAADRAVRAWMQALLERLAATAKGSSERFTRALLLDAPPSMAHAEVTDKGSINQRAVMQQRAGSVGLLYAEPAGAQVLRLPD